MKANKYFNFLLLIAILAFAGAVFAQDTKPVEGQPQPTPNQPQDVRNNVLRQLGLSKEQVQQIRRVNMERKPLMDEAQKHSREANRMLDEAIYADQINEGDIQARLKEVQLAQAEVARVRFMNEVAVRRILTPDQLVRFREFRQKFQQVRENIDSRRPINAGRENMRQNPDKVTRFRDGKPATTTVVRPNQPRPEQ